MSATNPAASPPRALVMLALVMAGEAVFLLPFMVGRIFRPTLLDVFHITNLELGLAYSTYGFVAMAAYLAGGPLADRFSTRGLMAVALIATAAGGVVMATVHTQRALVLLYAWWGLTTILLFWAALIRATRQWGGAHLQGRAYGILDGGRGLVAALFASAMVATFSSMLPEQATSATLEQRADALDRVVWIVAGFTVAVALVVLRFVPDGSAPRAGTRDSEPRRRLSLDGILAVARMRVLWLQSIIIVCAYVGYKAIDDVALYARDAFDYDAVESAELGTLTFWVRPFAAVVAGIIADRTRASTVVLACFALMVVGNLGLAADVIPPGAPTMLAMTLVLTCLGVFALRGLYFALFSEARLSLAHTGSAVGVVSFIGYTPDVFMGPLMGWLTDRSPGVLGHLHLYAVVAAFGALGLLSTLWFRRLDPSRSA